jgi:radical SAM superfamily enzyme YgiQ (UPF0313 family)
MHPKYYFYISKNFVVVQKVLLITPPFTQLNTPYPATAYLKGFLNTQNVPSFQCDLGIEVILKLFSSEGLKILFSELAARNFQLSPNARRIFDWRENYMQTIDQVIAFLQGRNDALAHVICNGGYFPEASRFAQIGDLKWAFGTMGIRDKARHLATLYLEDLSDLIVETIDPYFGFSRYAERLGRSANTFDELSDALLAPDSLIARITLQLLLEKMEFWHPALVAFSIPFPGNLFSGFKCAQYIKRYYPEVKTVMGGGFPNTELRSLTDVRVMEYFDFITLDDGEAPLWNLVEHLDGKRNQSMLKRTFVLENEEVVFQNGSAQPDFSPCEVGTPDFSDFEMDKYLSVIEIMNPMHRLWSDGRWNKLTLAHGCYWGRCAFCDTSLDYIRCYEPGPVRVLCDRMEEIIRETGQIGFHFVDEAAPPALMKALALEIIRRKMTVVWWTNIRFEKSFTYDLCLLLKKSGCIAVSGGLEVASDRLLALINKGVTVSQVTKVTDHFTRVGIMVHAYLMYGFPTQTAQETINSLEVVRQLFQAGVIQSGFWHQFALTVHSAVAMNPDKFRIRIENEKSGPFANNDLQFCDLSNARHDRFSEGLHQSIFNYMHGLCFEFQLQDWFDFKVPRTTIPPDFIQNIIDEQVYEPEKPTCEIFWLGGIPSVRIFTKKKKNHLFEMAELTFTNKKNDLIIQVDQKEGEWLMEQIPLLSVYNQRLITFAELQKSFEQHTGDDFVLFWNSPSIKELRKNGLLML